MTQFIVEHNLPISAGDHMMELLKAMFTDNKVAQDLAFKQTKTTHLIHEMADNKVSELKEMLQKGVFNIATDGSSNRGATEQ